MRPRARSARRISLFRTELDEPEETLRAIDVLTGGAEGMNVLSLEVAARHPALRRSTLTRLRPQQVHSAIFLTLPHCVQGPIRISVVCWYELNMSIA